jgi:hypothetical protein
MDYSQQIPSEVVAGSVSSFLVFIILTHLINIYFLWKHWDREELRVRGRKLTVLTFIGLAGAQVISTLIGTLATNNRPHKSWTQTPPKDWDFVVWNAALQFPFSLVFVLTPLLVKSFLLMFKLQIAKEQLVLASLARDQGSSARRSLLSINNWYSAHRHFLSGKFYIPIWVLWGVFCIPIPMTILGSGRLVLGCLMMGLQGIAIIIGFIFVGLKLRKSPMDFWHLKLEIYTYAFGFTISVLDFFLLVFVLWIFGSNIHNTWKSFFTYIGAALSQAVVVAFVTMRPLWKIADKSKERRHSRTISMSMNATAVEDLKFDSDSLQRPTEVLPDFFDKFRNNRFFQLLTNPEFEEEFRNHLASEFSLENLIFLAQVRSLYETCVVLLRSNDPQASSVEQLIQNGEEIGEVFLKANAPSALNVAYQLREKSLAKMERVSRDYKSGPDLRQIILDVSQVYQDAAVEVFHMLQNDSFRRFKTSEAYNKFQQKQMAVMVVADPNPGTFSV